MHRERTTLAIVTAIHGRHELTRLMIRSLARLARRVSDLCQLWMFAAVSPDDVPLMNAIRETVPLGWVCVPNHPVSFKWQAALSGLRAWCSPPPDAVMILGSDDWISEAWLRYAVCRVDIERDAAFGPDAVWLLDGRDGACYYLAPPILIEWGQIPIGAGRTLSRSVLDRVNWTLWTGPRDRGLDGQASRHLNDAYDLRLDPVPIAAIPGACVVDVKACANLNPMGKFKRLSPLDAEESRRVIDLAGIPLTDVMQLAAAEHPDVQNGPPERKLSAPFEYLKSLVEPPSRGEPVPVRKAGYRSGAHWHAR